MNELQSDVDKIDDLVNTCRNLMREADIYNFLDQYKTIMLNIE